MEQACDSGFAAFRICDVTFDSEASDIFGDPLCAVSIKVEDGHFVAPPAQFERVSPATSLTSTRRRFAPIYRAG